MGTSVKVMRAITCKYALKTVIDWNIISYVFNSNNRHNIVLNLNSSHGPNVLIIKETVD